MFTVGTSLPGRLPDIAIEVDDFDQAFAILTDEFILGWDEDIEALEDADLDITETTLQWRDGLRELRTISTITQDFDYLFKGLVYFIREYDESD